MKNFFKNYRSVVTCIAVYFLLLSSGLSEKVLAQINSESITRSLNSYIDSVYNAENLPGVVAEIFTPDFTYQYKVGKGDLQTGVERRYDDKIRVGSITKTFTATVILQLIQEGKFALEDPLSKFFPEYPNSENIKIREILDMTSGIPDFLEDPTLGNDFFYNRTAKVTEREIFDATIELGPAFPPGTSWQYSNGNYNILGMIIEKVTGNKVGDEITNRIIKTLGLVNTEYPVENFITGDYSHGYMTDTATGKIIDVTIIDPSITGAAGCIVSNFTDLKIYGLALAKGSMLNKEMQEQRLKFVKTGIVDFATYGLGIFDIGGFIGHNGGITGFNTMMCYNPELDALFLVSVNEFGPKGGAVDKIFMELAKIVYPDKNLFK